MPTLIRFTDNKLGKYPFKMYGVYVTVTGECSRNVANIVILILKVNLVHLIFNKNNNLAKK